MKKILCILLSAVCAFACVASTSFAAFAADSQIGEAVQQFTLEEDDYSLYRDSVTNEVFFHVSIPSDANPLLLTSFKFMLNGNDSFPCVTSLANLKSGEKITITVENTTEAPLDATLVISGDINCDGKVNTSDYLALRKALLGGGSSSESSGLMLRAVAINGNVSAASYIALRRYIFGTTSKMPTPAKYSVGTNTGTTAGTGVSTGQSMGVSGKVA